MEAAGLGRDLALSSRGEMVVVLAGVVAVGMELLGQNQELTWQGCTDRLSIWRWDVRETEALGVVPRFLAGFIGRLVN